MCDITQKESRYCINKLKNICENKSVEFHQWTRGAPQPVHIRRMPVEQPTVSLTVSPSQLEQCKHVGPSIIAFSAGIAGNPPRSVDKAVHYFWTLPWTNPLSVLMGRQAFSIVPCCCILEWIFLQWLHPSSFSTQSDWFKIVVCWDYEWCLKVNTFRIVLGVTTWSWAWIIDALL